MLEEAREEAATIVAEARSDADRIIADAQAGAGGRSKRRECQSVRCKRMRG
jgi:vacuolar-type H+-ATPase subunit H